MALTADDIKTLNNLVGLAVQTIPRELRILKEPEMSTKFMLKTPEDYVLGRMTGYVLGGMMQYWIQKNSRPMTKDESNEVTAMVNNRIWEFRNALFKSG